MGYFLVTKWHPQDFSLYSVMSGKNSAFGFPKGPKYFQFILKNSFSELSNQFEIVYGQELYLRLAGDTCPYVTWLAGSCSGQTRPRCSRTLPRDHSDRNPHPSHVVPVWVCGRESGDGMLVSTWQQEPQYALTSADG